MINDGTDQKISRPFLPKMDVPKLITIISIVLVMAVLFTLFPPDQASQELKEGNNIKTPTVNSTPTPVSIEGQITELSKQPSSVPTRTPTNTPISTATPTLSPSNIFNKIGQEVAGENSNVSVFKNSDGSWDAVNNIQLTPELTLGMDAYKRKWVTDFLSKSYTSGINVRYVLITVSLLGTGEPTTRVGLGIKYAKLYTSEEWKEFTPYDLCSWIKSINIGDDLAPLDPDYNPTGWAFVKNYKCI